MPAEPRDIGGTETLHMAKDIIDVVFIGAGSLSTMFHYPALADMPDVRLKAVCDLLPKRAERNAAGRSGVG